MFDEFYTSEDAEPTRISGGYAIDGNPQSSATFVVTPGDGDPEALDTALPRDTGDDVPDLGDKYISTVSSVLVENATVNVQFVTEDKRGNIVAVSDGKTIITADDPELVGKPDPLAGLSLRDRRKAAADSGVRPRVTVTGTVGGVDISYRTSSWGLVTGTSWGAVGRKLKDTGTVNITLTPDSFIARSGPQAGRQVHIIRPSLEA